MRRALFVALAVHLGILLVGGYIYVLPPGEREKIFRAILHSQKIMPMKKVRTAPKKRLKKAPTVRPIRRTKSIELIGVRRGVASEFTVPLPEISRAVYTPQIALVSIPEPTMDKGLGDFWETQLKLRDTAGRLESFGVSTLKPLGSVGNPVTQLRFTFTAAGSSLTELLRGDLGLMFPEHRRIMGAGAATGTSVPIGPYAVPPEKFVFYMMSTGYTSPVRMWLSTDPRHCRITTVGMNTYKYTWELGEGDGDWNDLVFTVTFLGGQGR